MFYFSKNTLFYFVENRLYAIKAYLLQHNTLYIRFQYTVFYMLKHYLLKGKTQAITT